MRYGCLRFCALVLSILALTANRTSAQVNTVNLSGTVLDPQGLGYDKFGRGTRGVVRDLFESV